MFDVFWTEVRNIWRKHSSNASWWPFTNKFVSHIIFELVMKNFNKDKSRMTEEGAAIHMHGFMAF